MTKHQSHLHLTTRQVAEACLDESQQDRAQEQGFCFELFQRAFDKKDGTAWEAIQLQYRKLIRQWLQSTAKEVLTIEREEDLTQDTFHCFWKSVGKRTEPLADRFPHVGALLRYLRQCAYTAVIMEQRQEKKQRLLQDKLAQIAKDQATSQIALWEQEKETKTQIAQIQQYISLQIEDPQEKRLLKLVYTLGLKPREIVERCPEEFATVKDVQRVKERVLKRMRRALAP
ncbi:MAG: hypothetical protein AAF614_18435 [Chloroflexota bacterium]